MAFSSKYTRKRRKKKTTIINDYFIPYRCGKICKFFSISIIRFLSLRRNDGATKPYVSSHISLNCLCIDEGFPVAYFLFDWLYGELTACKTQRLYKLDITHSIQVYIQLCGSLSFDYYMTLHTRETKKKTQTLYIVRKKKLGRNFHRFNQWTNIVISLPFFSYMSLYYRNYSTVNKDTLVKICTCPTTKTAFAHHLIINISILYVLSVSVGGIGWPLYWVDEHHRLFVL